MSDKVWCECADPLPAAHNWKCSACGEQRRYFLSMSVANGGCVSVCGECRYDARKTGEKPPQRLVRFVTCVRLVAGSLRDSATYLMCDPHIDKEINLERAGGAKIVDGRSPVLSGALNG